MLLSVIPFEAVNSYESNVYGRGYLLDALSRYKGLLSFKTSSLRMTISWSIAFFWFGVMARYPLNIKPLYLLIFWVFCALAIAWLFRDLYKAYHRADVRLGCLEHQLKRFCDTVAVISPGHSNPLKEDFSKTVQACRMIEIAHSVIIAERRGAEEAAAPHPVLESLILHRSSAHVRREELYRLREAAARFGLCSLTKKECYALAEMRFESDKLDKMYP